MIIRIKNLRLRCLIGINDWEREHKQDVVVNAELEFDGGRAAQSDNIADTVNYKTITKKIIALVESAQYGLLEKLCAEVLDICMSDPRVRRATVEIDKPGALRYCDSVSVTAAAQRGTTPTNPRAHD
ncbi:MAG: dihydroneopterin triphosphate 2'-epimerase [Candidatus Sumerlaeia bacterium]